jgi:hypothetical protein
VFVFPARVFELSEDDGGYEQASRVGVAVVTEPSSIIMLVLGLSVVRLARLREHC